MKITGQVQDLRWNERHGELKLSSYEKAIWIDSIAKVKVKGLKVGDTVTVTANPGRYYEFLTDIERGEAAPVSVPSPKTNSPPNVSQPEPTPETSNFNIPYSYKRIGPLYPLLVDFEGNIIDGLHRHAVDPDWRKEVVPWVRSRKDFLVARIHANLHRRDIPKEERQREFTELANILHNEGAAIGELVSKIVDLTGFSDRYVRELLPKSFKLRTAPTGPKTELSSVSQPASLPDAKADVEEEARKRGEIAAGAPAQAASDLFTGPCPFCGKTIRWDQERKVFAKAA